MKSRLGGKILFYLALDVFGIAVFSTGVFWFVRGGQLLFRHFPSSSMEAVVAIVGGLLLMIVSVMQIIREIARRVSLKLQEEKGRS